MTRFPIGTMACNLLGCLLIAFFAGLVVERQRVHAHAKLLLVTGFPGGFTTFSSFGYETVGPVRQARSIIAVANVALHILVGLFAVWLGLLASRWVLCSV